MNKGREKSQKLEVDIILDAAKEQAVVREYYKTHLLAKSYQAVFPKTSEAVARERCKEILRKPENIQYMQDLIDRNAAKGYASLDRVKSFLTEVMEGKVSDQFGLEASLADRIKAAEDIIAEEHRPRTAEDILAQAKADISPDEADTPADAEVDRENENEYIQDD